MEILNNDKALKRSLAKDICQTGVALLLFLLGVLTYIGFRSDNLRMFSWADALGVHSVILYIRECFCNISVGSFVSYSLPDGLWLLAYLMIIDAIWRENSKGKLFFITLLPFSAICSEIFQLIGIVNGVFDILDLAAYLGAILIYKLLKTYAL